MHGKKEIFSGGFLWGTSLTSISIIFHLRPYVRAESRVLSFVVTVDEADKKESNLEETWNTEK